MADFIAGQPSLDHLPKAFEFIEAALLHSSRTDPEVSASVDFTYQSFNELGGEYPQSAKTVQAFKTARNRVVHGYLSHLRISDLELSFVGIVSILQLLKAIGGRRVRDRIELGIGECAPLVRSLMKRHLPDTGGWKGVRGERFHQIARDVWVL